MNSIIAAGLYSVTLSAIEKRGFQEANILAKRHFTSGSDRTGRDSDSKLRAC
jgi:hypothetical protein